MILSPTQTNTPGFKLNFAAIFVIAAFVLNDSVRLIVSEKFSWINILFLISFTFYFLISLKKGSINITIAVIVLSFTAIVLTNTLFLNKNILYYIMTIANLLAPLLLLSVKINYKQALNSLKITLLIINPLVIVLLILGMVDYFSGNSIQLLLANSVYSGTQLGELIHKEISWGIYRYYSFLGHPLQTAKYFLVFYILNSVYGKYEKKLIPPLILSSVTVLGLIISGSKTALLLGLIILIFFSGLKKYKAAYYISIAFALLFFFNTTLFQENLKMRFLQGIEDGDMTSGRNMLLDTLINSDVEKPSFFLGGGADYSREVAKSLNGHIQNFEYPFIMLMYDYGVMGMLIIYGILFVYPIISLLKKRNYYILGLFLMLVLMVNTNNGLSSLASDTIISFCIVTLILVNLKPVEHKLKGIRQE